VTGSEEIYPVPVRLRMLGQLADDLERMPSAGWDRQQAALVRTIAAETRAGNRTPGARRLVGRLADQLAWSLNYIGVQEQVAAGQHEGYCEYDPSLVPDRPLDSCFCPVRVRLKTLAAFKEALTRVVDELLARGDAVLTMFLVEPIYEALHAEVRLQQEG
jgi:hypothetical protein